jgi:hypothetical protein
MCHSAKSWDVMNLLLSYPHFAEVPKMSSIRTTGFKLATLF